ncbi:MAG TPA: nitroreductase [Gammaproteobacteria bacterium]|jgi:nitroreductase|nr:nitroreductase [Gammaproteobacteria bacterium]|tara:strand:+ start:3583 stop:4311 length:729 start_codon:yes stop_codon:yes gene_type:complete
MNNLSTETETATKESTVADPDMGLIDAVYARHSVRGFLDKEVPEDVLNRLFEIAQQAPSNCNVQPWKAYIASGELKERLKKQMVENVTTGVKSNPDYEYQSDFENEYRVKQVECAVALYTKMGIGRGDKEGRMRASLRNFEYFDAPYIAFIGMDPKFGVPVALDVGMWAQTLMLTMVAFGLHSCPMGTMRNYPDLVREAFDIQDGTKILFGISFGYEDVAVPANETRTTRDDISANVFFRSN